MADSLISVVVPVYNEGPNILRCVSELYESLRSQPHEILVCYDFDEDDTLVALDGMLDPPPTLRRVHNRLGRGPAWAMRAGFAASRGDVIVTTMADLSDPPQVIPAMAERIRSGASVVSGSRYMRGGRQVGGPLLKRTLSRLAGLSLYWLAGLETHDCTNNFRAYSAEFVRGVAIQSVRGFELGLELTVQAFVRDLRIAEVPTTWTDRTRGESRFRLLQWLPVYLRWYLLAVRHGLWRRWSALMGRT